MSRAKDNAIAFVVFSRQNRVASFGYRIWAMRTSFYIKNRDVDLPVKVSIHGPDPDPRNRPGFKFAVDGVKTLHHESTAWRFEDGARPGWFLGADAAPGVKHLVRIRFPWSTFEPGSPSGDQPTMSKSVGQHLLLSAPDPLKAADVDVYLSDTGKPYWPDEEQARIDNAIMGPLTNDAGQILTAVATHRSLWRDVATEELAELSRGHTGPLGRIIAVNGDETGFLWMREVIAPNTMLRPYDADELHQATHIPPRQGT